MGLILDTSILIANERGRFNFSALRREFATVPWAISVITASELLHGVQRADDGARRHRRSQYVEEILGSIPVLAFTLELARTHSHLWANLESRGERIGSHDLLIAATALAMNWDLVSLDVSDFQRIPSLSLVDATAYLIN